MKFILTPLFNAFFQFWNQLHRQISSVITRVFPTEATHVYGAKKMLKMIPIVRFLRLCPKKIQCPLIYLFEKNLMNYYYSYFTDFLMTCVLEAEITRFVYPWFHCPSYIRIRGRKRTLHKEGTRPSVTWNGLLFRRVRLDPSYIIKVVCRCLAMLDKSVLFLSRVACTSAIRSLAPRAVDPPIEMLWKQQLLKRTSKWLRSEVEE